MQTLISPSERAKGRISGESHEQKERRYELNQKDSKDRGPAVPSERVTGFFGIIYVPSRLIVSGNAAATANNILASERLFRLGIVSELICAAEFVFLVWVLYRLLGAVNKTHASLMVILGLASFHYVRECANEIAALTLLGGGIPVGTGQPQRKPWPCCSSICMLQVRYRLDLWPWLFLRVCKSGFLPRILGVLLIAACFGYLAG